MTVDDARAAVIAGDGVVARFPGLLCVARGTDRDVVARLLEVCASVAGTDPGRPLARRLARWLGGPDAPDDDLVFGTLASAGDQLGIFLVGATSISVAGSSVVLSGVDAATWTDRLIPRPDTPVVLALEGTVPPSGLAGGPNDLRAGVVPGAGAVLFAGPTDRRPDDARGPARGDPEQDDPARDDHAWFADPLDVRAPVPVSVPSPDPSRPPENGSTGPVARVEAAPEAANGYLDLPIPTWSAPPRNGSRPAGRHAILDRGVAQDGSRGPDPDHGTAGPSTLPGDDAVNRTDPPVFLDRPVPADPGSVPGEPAATGPSSSSSTLFLEAEPPPPAAVEVATAGSSLPHRTGRLPTQRSRESEGTPVAGARLPLGRIVFDDGATFTVDAPFLVGRMPESDPRARSGEFRPMVVDDDSGSVSRVHAEILIKGWDVVLVDSGSRNGTFVAGPDESAWTALGPGRTSLLVPGTRVRMGGRTFVFEPGAVDELRP